MTWSISHWFVSQERRELDEQVRRQRGELSHALNRSDRFQCLGERVLSAINRDDDDERS